MKRSGPASPGIVMALRLYNSMSRTKEEFKPLDASNVRMYVCGPTVYDNAHIGNARPVIVFDVLYRLLRHIYGEEHVTYVRNITDIDDKINARAKEEGTSIRELTERTYGQFRKDISALGVLEPTFEPRATETIPEMIDIIGRLIARGHAYVVEGHVLFAVPSMKDYGKLSRRPLDEMIAGARVDVAPYKKDPMDFVLWKPSDAETPGWESPWGRGRPGWHIECSAMSWKLLGEEFDIHGGGIDLLFPHHENELAQTTCAFGHPRMANVWMHNGFLQVEGRKMAKSEGNFITIRENLQRWHNSSWPGEAIRFSMLRANYREPIDWTFSALDEAHKYLWDLYGWLENAPNAEIESRGTIDALCDDLNTAKLRTLLSDFRKEKSYGKVRWTLDLLGFSGDRSNLRRDSFAPGATLEVTSSIESGKAFGTPTIVNKPTVESLITERLQARKSRNWAESDRIRDELAAMGVVLKDNKDGTTSWEVKR
jgi:cysteinyl-tRNA synthetase